VPDLHTQPSTPTPHRHSPLARAGLACFVFLVVYASLYPFAGWTDMGVSPFAYLTAPLPRYNTVFDVVTNVWGYMPLGMLTVLALHPRITGWRAVLIALGAGLLLSGAMEAIQTYLPTRVSSNVDLATNTLGALLGAIVMLPFSARLIDQGCVVSESPVGARAQARDFPRRNRIISGLSRGVVVVEAEIKSGSLITARLAAEQGRDVFAVPGSPLDPRAKGPNELLRQGAILCEGIEDIERAFNTLRSLRAPPSEPMDYGEVDDAFLDRVAALLSPTPTPRDEIARALNAPMGQVAAALLELSLAGRAELLPGGLASI
jgi:VanZ family protein